MIDRRLTFDAWRSWRFHRRLEQRGFEAFRSPEPLPYLDPFERTHA